MSTSSSPVRVETFLDRTRSRELRVGVIGIGYVGLPLTLLFSEQKFRVTGFDVDRQKVDALSAGRSYIYRILPEEIAAAKSSGFTATTNYAEISQLDAIVICVPTPLNEHHEPDLTYVENTARAIAPHIRPGQLVVLESTTYPGTTRDVVKPILESSGLKSGRDFFIAFSPEREDPGNMKFSTRAIPKVIGGDGKDAAAIADALYSTFVPNTVPVSSPETAEAVKLTENIFRSVNI